MMNTNNRRALTLMELVLVLAVLIALTAIATPLIQNTAENSRETATMTTLVRVRDLLVNTYRPDMGGYPEPNALVKDADRLQYPQLRYLFLNPKTETPVADFNPTTAIGWRGPYLQHLAANNYVLDVTRGFTNLYGKNAIDPIVPDAWGNPIVLQYKEIFDVNGRPILDYSRLVSAGPNGILDTPSDEIPPDLTKLDSVDDLVLFLRAPDQRQ